MDSLRVERLKRGFSQKEMAELLGLSPSYFNRVEKGRVPLPDILKEKIKIFFSIEDGEEEEKEDKEAKEKLSSQSYEIYKEYANKKIDIKELKTSSKVNPNYFNLSLESQKMVDNFIDALLEAEKKNEESK